MKDINKMNRVELKDHMMSLVSEANYNKTLIEKHDTGYIIDYVSRLEDRIESISACLVSPNDIEKKTEDDPYKGTIIEGKD